MHIVFFLVICVCVGKSFLITRSTKYLNSYSYCNYHSNYYSNSYHGDDNRNRNTEKSITTRKQSYSTCSSIVLSMINNGNNNYGNNNYGNNNYGNATAAAKSSFLAPFNNMNLAKDLEASQEETSRSKGIIPVGPESFKEQNNKNSKYDINDRLRRYFFYSSFVNS